MAEYEDAAAEISKLDEDKKQFKEDQKKAKVEAKAQRKEAKKKAKELADEEARIADDYGSTWPVVVTTIIIILVWVGIVAALIKLDIGGFGSGVLAPILKDVPVVNMILPEGSVDYNENDPDAVDTSGYKSLKEAVREINNLQSQLIEAQSNSAAKDEQISSLREEVNRLQDFEDRALELERIKNEFYNEVVYAENGPGADEYVKYYQSMDPTTAETLYKQVIVEEALDEKLEDYVKAYSDMKPKQAAAIFMEMTDNLDLVSKILWEMGADARAAILGAMDADVAAKLTKMMEPDD